MENNTNELREDTNRSTDYSDNEILFANNKLLSQINSKLAWVVFMLAIPYIVSLLYFLFLAFLGVSWLSLLKIK